MLTRITGWVSSSINSTYIRDKTAPHQRTRSRYPLLLLLRDRYAMFLWSVFWTVVWMSLAVIAATVLLRSLRMVAKVREHGGGFPGTRSHHRFLCITHFTGSAERFCQLVCFLGHKVNEFAHVITMIFIQLCFFSEHHSEEKPVRLYPFMCEVDRLDEVSHQGLQCRRRHSTAPLPQQVSLNELYSFCCEFVQLNKPIT